MNLRPQDKSWGTLIWLDFYEDAKAIADMDPNSFHLHGMN